jgi:hypothetical protein
MFRYQAMRESGLPEDVLSRIVQTGRERGQAIDAGARRGLYMEPSIAPTLTESQTRDITQRGVAGLMPGPVGNIIAQQARAAEAARIGGIPAETDIFALEGPETAPAAAIAAALEPRARPAEAPTPVVPERAPAQLTRNPYDVQKSFVSAMQAFEEASGQEVSEEKNIDDYMKEFSEVTGIDISGKPDKSAALMAFGLALMQNRAGSGFNVGNILRSVGEAGEAALPELKAAKQEAKAARMAAGKYALEQVQAGKNARAALAQEEREYRREVALKLLELESEAAKAARQGVKFESVAQLEVQPQSGIKVTTGIDLNGNAVLVKPSLEVSGVINGYNRYTKGQELSRELIETLEAIDQAGAPGFQRLYSDFAGTLSNFGIPMPAYDPEEVSNAAKADALRTAMIVGFKRAITQESQVSDKDVTFMNQSIGEFTASTPIARVIESAKMFNDYLGTQKKYYSDELQKFSNPRYYAGRNEEFIDVQEQITDSILDPRTYIVNPSEAEAQSSNVVGNVDLTARRQ